MKRKISLLSAALVTGICLAACIPSAPQAPTFTPDPTIAAATTVAGPTTVAEPTSQTEPSPTSPAFSGTVASFDRLSVVIPTGLAAGGSGMLVPEARGENVAPWEVAPEHIRFTLDGYALESKFFEPQIFVFPAQAYAELQERGTAAQSLERLRAVLARDAMVDLNELPTVPFFNVFQALAAQVRVIPFQDGRGVRMVTQYAMGRAIINNSELIYHFEGLTDDGGYYVIAILPATAPGLPEDGQPGGAVPPGGIPVPDFNNMDSDWMGYFGQVREMLQGLEHGAYTPDLDQLDALIESLRISPTN